MEVEAEAVERPQSRYYNHYVLPKETEFLSSISKETIILVFAAFFIGLLMGKSMTPVVLKH